MIPKRSTTYEDALLNNIVTTEDGEFVTILEWVEQMTTVNKEFTVDMEYMKKILGPEFSNRNDDTVGTALRSSFKKHGIDMRRRSYSDGMKLTMSLIIQQD